MITSDNGLTITRLLPTPGNHDTIPIETRMELERIERQLIPLLISIQRLLGKEPCVATRKQRRKQTGN